MLKTKSKLFLLTILLSIYPVMADAASVSSLTSNNFQTIVEGSLVTSTGGCWYESCYCDAKNGPFITTVDLNTVLQSLTAEIIADGEVFNTGQVQQMQAMKTLDNQYLQEDIQDEKNKVIAQMQNHMKNVTSPTLSASQPLISGCTQGAWYASKSQGLANGRQEASGYVEFNAAVDNGGQSGLTMMNQLANAPADTLTANTINPSATTVSAAYPTPAAIAETIAHITNPEPPEKLTTEQTWVPAGGRWKAIHHQELAKLTTAQDTLAQIAAWNSPVVSATEATTIWDEEQKALGNTTSGTKKNVSSVPPGVADINGKPMISPDGFLNLSVQVMYADPEYYGILLHENDAGLSKQNTDAEAIALRESWQSLRTSEHITQMLAVEYAHQAVSKESGQLDSLSGDAMAQQDGSLNNAK